ncbi:MAG: DNRLRE domain-containing protein, partial [Dehalobacterium sp.]
MATQTLLSTGTTFVSSVLDSVNLSFSAIIIVGTDPVFGDSISFLKFMIPALPVATVDSAKLRLFVFVKTEGPPSPVVVNRVTSVFDIDTVTYNTQPTYEPTASMINVTMSDVLQYVEIDVTTLVNQWLNGTYPNEGIALTNPDGTTAVQFGGKSIGAAYEPQLVLTYSAEVPEITNYAYVYNTGNQNIPLESSIPFSSNGALLGVSHNAGTGPITLEDAGTYAVWFIVTGQSANQFALFQNEVEVPGGIYGTELASVANPGMAMISAEAGDVLTIQNHTSTGAVDLNNATGGT